MEMLVLYSTLATVMSCWSGQPEGPARKVIPPGGIDKLMIYVYTFSPLDYCLFHSLKLLFVTAWKAFKML